MGRLAIDTSVFINGEFANKGIEKKAVGRVCFLDAPNARLQVNCAADAVLIGRDRKRQATFFELGDIAGVAMVFDDVFASGGFGRIRCLLVFQPPEGELHAGDRRIGPCFYLFDFNCCRYVRYRTACTDKRGVLVFVCKCENNRVA